MHNQKKCQDAPASSVSTNERQVPGSTTVSITTSKYHINCTQEASPPLTSSKHRPTKSCCKDPKKGSVSIDVDALERCPAKDNGYLKLLDVIKRDTPCACAVTARAVRSNVHMNLGLTDLQGRIKPHDNCECEDDKIKPGPAKSE